MCGIDGTSSVHKERTDFLSPRFSGMKVNPNDMHSLKNDMQWWTPERISIQLNPFQLSECAKIRRKFTQVIHLHVQSREGRL